MNARRVLATGILAGVLALFAATSAAGAGEATAGQDLVAGALGIDTSRLRFDGPARPVTDVDSGLFRVDGGAPSGPDFLDLQQGSQVGLQWDARPEELFGTGKNFDCALASVGCPSTALRLDKFATGATTFAWELAEPIVRPIGTEVLRIALLAYDPRYPLLADPRPNSPFTRANKVWVLEVTATGETLHYLQVDNGALHEFRSDAIAGFSGARGFHAVAPAAFAGVTEWDLHTYLLAAPAEAGDTLIGVPRRGPLIAVGGPTVRIAPPLVAGPGAVAVVDGGSAGFPAWAWVAIAAAGASLALVGGRLLLVPRTDEKPTALGYMEKPILGDDAAALVQWRSALAREKELQQRLETTYARIAKDVASELARFQGAADTFADGFNGIMIRSQTMQDIAADWAAARKIAGGFDLVIALVTAGTALVKLGQGGWRSLARLFGASDEAVQLAQQAKRGSEAWKAAEAAIEADSRLIQIYNDAAKIAFKTPYGGMSDLGAADIFVEAVMLAREAGIPAEEVARRITVAELKSQGLAEGIQDVWLGLAHEVAVLRGWVKADGEAADLVRDVIVNVRSYARGGVTDPAAAAALVERFRALAQSRPDLLEWAGKLYTQVGGAQSSDTFLTLVCGADDVTFLGWLSEKLAAGAKAEDLPGLWRSELGPVGQLGWSELNQIRVVGARTYNLASMSGPFTPTSIVPDATGYIGQHGMVNPSFFGMTADSTLGWSTIHLLNFFGAPVTWLTNFWASMEANELYADFLDDFGPELSAMGGAAVTMLAAVDRLVDITTMSTIDPALRNELRGIIGDLQNAMTAGTPVFRETMAPGLAERTAHIEQKVAQLDRAAGGLVGAGNGLLAIRDALATRVRADRTAIQWADPDLVAAFGATGMILDGLAGDVLGKYEQPLTPLGPRVQPAVPYWERDDWPTGETDYTSGDPVVVVDFDTPPPPPGDD